MPTFAWRQRRLEIALVLAVFASRAIHADQPILENYVGRQVPTAMVARNLDRGSGFLAPRLDTGPFPNLFLVEPPIDAQVVASVSRWTRLPIDTCGRLVSALATALAAWGLFGLVRSRAGPRVAALAVIAFAAFPVTIRYGRAFQPDAFAMGCTVAALRCFDAAGRLRGWLGGALLSLGLAQKVTWSFVLIPLCLEILRQRPWRSRLFPVACLVPALCWYLHVAVSLAGGDAGSSTTSENAANWIDRLAPSSLLERGRYLIVGRDLIVRSFTPLGAALACLGLWGRRSLWSLWAIAAGGTLALLFGKLHHDYYWLMLAPPAAACAGIGLDRLASRSPSLGGLAVAALIALGCFQTRSTWKTPDEWRDAVALGRAIRRHVPRGEVVIAAEAVIYLGDRPGCRLEWEPASARRALSEWNAKAGDRPEPIVDFYRINAGARYFADLVTDKDDREHARYREGMRNAPGVQLLEDEPGRYILVRFEGSPARRGQRP